MEGWITARLVEVTTKIGSGATPKGGKNAYKDDGIPLIRSLNIYDNEFRPKNLAFIDDAQAEKLSNVIVVDGDVLINITGASIARCCEAPKEYLPARVNQHVSIVRPKTNVINPTFLARLLASRVCKDVLLVAGEKAGATRQALTKSQLQEFAIPLPPLPEQQRIVAILDETFEAIATAIANAEKNVANARELFESYLNKVVEKAKGRTNSVPIANICHDQRIITYGVIKLGLHEPNGVPCLRTSNVRWLKIETDKIKRISSTLSQDYIRSVLEGREVLVNVRGTLGGVAVVPPDMAGWNVSREVAVVPCDEGKINPGYLAFCIGAKNSQDWLTGVSKGAAYTGINLEDLRTLEVPILSMDEQIEVNRKLTAVLNECRKLEAIGQQKLNDLAELKQSILQKAFSGELKAHEVAA